MGCTPVSNSGFGNLVVSSTTRPTGVDLFAGLSIFEADTGRTLIYDGTTWVVTYAVGTWVPTLGGVAIGTGGSAGVSASYSYSPSGLAIDVAIVLGTAGFSVTATPSISLPSGFTASRANSSLKTGLGVALISAGGYVEGLANLPSTTAINLFALNAASTYGTRSSISATVPATWAANDQIFVNGLLKGILA